MASNKAKTVVLTPNDRVLFLGDSITDADRERDNPQDMGRGYCGLIANWISAAYPQGHVEFFNRGISGDRTEQLLERWERDCVELQPTVISLLIGINHTIPYFKLGERTTLETFEQLYLKLLTLAAKLTGRLIVISPFALPIQSTETLPLYVPLPANWPEWERDLLPKIAKVHALAQAFDAVYIPLHELLQTAISKREAAYWLPDGIHPSSVGHALLAQAWLEHITYAN